MAIKRHIAQSHTKEPQEDIARCRQNMRFLLVQLTQSLPAHQPGFQSALLLHFQRASDAAGVRNHPAQRLGRSR